MLSLTNRIKIYQFSSLRVQIAFGKPAWLGSKNKILSPNYASQHISAKWRYSRKCAKGLNISRFNNRPEKKLRRVWYQLRAAATQPCNMQGLLSFPGQRDPYRLQCDGDPPPSPTLQPDRSLVSWRKLVFSWLPIKFLSPNPIPSRECIVDIESVLIAVGRQLSSKLI